MSLQAVLSHRTSALAHRAHSSPLPAASRYRPRRALFGLSCAVGTVALCTQAYAHHGMSRPVADPAARSEGISLGLGRAEVPPGIRSVGLSRGGQSVVSIDYGLPVVISQDRRDGYRSGSIQEFRDGARRLRVVARIYVSSAGARRAYLRSAHLLRVVLPDPTLQTTVSQLTGIGAWATMARFSSVAGHQRYTVHALVMLAGPAVVQLQASPDGAATGDETHDRADLTRLARLFAARAVKQGTTG